MGRGTERAGRGKGKLAECSDLSPQRRVHLQRGSMAAPCSGHWRCDHPPGVLADVFKPRPKCACHTKRAPVTAPSLAFLHWDVLTMACSSGGMPQVKQGGSLG